MNPDHAEPEHMHKPPTDYSFDVIPDHPEAHRPDSGDLTQKFWHLKYQETDPWWMVLIGSGFVGAIALMPWCVIGIIAYWLGKQAGLWG